MLKFLADENISPFTAAIVREKGYDIQTVDEVGLSGLDDEKIVNYAQKQKRIILTFDLDFGEMYYFGETTKVGIIVLRIKPHTVELVNEVLGKFLDTKVIETKKIDYSLIILGKNKYRHREKI